MVSQHIHFFVFTDFFHVVVFSSKVHFLVFITNVPINRKIWKIQSAICAGNRQLYIVATFYIVLYKGPLLKYHVHAVLQNCLHAVLQYRLLVNSEYVAFMKICSGFIFSLSSLTILSQFNMFYKYLENIEFQKSNTIYQTP